MHAYHRMEADQTDSIAVCATKEEWGKILQRIPWDVSEETQGLIEMLGDLGVEF